LVELRWVKNNINICFCLRFIPTKSKEVNKMLVKKVRLLGRERERERYLPSQRDIGCCKVGEAGVRLTPSRGINRQALASRH
jgi:hypothetical protein